jgi:hypothetical protein
MSTPTSYKNHNRIDSFYFTEKSKPFMCNPTTRRSLERIQEHRDLRSLLIYVGAQETLSSENRNRESKWIDQIPATRLMITRTGPWRISRRYWPLLGRRRRTAGREEGSGGADVRRAAAARPDVRRAAAAPFSSRGRDSGGRRGGDLLLAAQGQRRAQRWRQGQGQRRRWESGARAMGIDGIDGYAREGRGRSRLTARLGRRDALPQNASRVSYARRILRKCVSGIDHATSKACLLA